MMASLEQLAQELLEQPKQKANNLPKLVKSISLAKPDVSAVPVLRALQQYFIGAFERGELSARQPSAAGQPASQQQSPEAVYEAWLRRQYTSYLAALLGLLSAGPDARTQVAALGALMECVRGEEVGVFNNQLFGRVLEAAVRGAGVQPEVLGALLSPKYIGCADVRYYTLRSIARIAAKHSGAAGAGAGEASDDEEAGAAAGAGEENGTTAGPSFVSAHDLARNLHDVLTQVPPFEEGAAAGELQSWCGAAEVGAVAPASDADGSRQRKKRKLAAGGAGGAGAGGAGQVQRAKWASAKLQKKALSDAWLAFLRLDLPDDTYRRVLTRLHDAVLPAVFNPLLLSDFLTYSLDKGGLIGMLALNGIFILVTRHGLEYPGFYARLYALLDPAAFQAKHRARFFQLADVFLASAMVPAYTAASFAKKFARLALTASPAGALVCLAFIHNIIRRHPACLQMLHRPPRGATAGAAAGAEDGSSGGGEAAAGQAAGAAGGQAGSAAVYSGDDLYDAEQPDPALTRAIESSLWELEALRRHANPTVSAFCSMLEKDLSDRRKTAEIDLSELLLGSYASLFSAEAERRMKAVPAAFYQRPPTRLFDANCAADFAGWAV